MRALPRLKPGAYVRVRVPGRFPGATGVVLSVGSRWATVALGWSERRIVLRRDIVEIVSGVGPLRPGGEYASARLSAAVEPRPDGDGPGGGPDGPGEPYQLPSTG